MPSPTRLSFRLRELKAHGQAMPALKGHTNTITCLAFSKDGAILVSGAKDGVVIIWNVHAKKALFTLPAHKEMVTLVAISPDAQVLNCEMDH